MLFSDRHAHAPSDRRAAGLAPRPPGGKAGPDALMDCVHPHRAIRRTVPAAVGQVVTVKVRSFAPRISRGDLRSPLNFWFFSSMNQRSSRLRRTSFPGRHLLERADRFLVVDLPFADPDAFAESPCGITGSWRRSLRVSTTRRLKATTTRAWSLQLLFEHLRFALLGARLRGRYRPLHFAIRPWIRRAAEYSVTRVDELRVGEMGEQVIVAAAVEGLGDRLHCLLRRLLRVVDRVELDVVGRVRNLAGSWAADRPAATPIEPRSTRSPSILP